MCDCVAFCAFYMRGKGALFIQFSFVKCGSRWINCMPIDKLCWLRYLVHIKHYQIVASCSCACACACAWSMLYGLWCMMLHFIVCWLDRNWFWFMSICMTLCIRNTNIYFWGGHFQYNFEIEFRIDGWIGDCWLSLVIICSKQMFQCMYQNNEELICHFILCICNSNLLHATKLKSRWDP